MPKVAQQWSQADPLLSPCLALQRYSCNNAGSGAGTAHTPQLQVYCNSGQGQAAHGQQQEGPDISSLQPFYRSSGTMLPMLDWVTLLLNRTANARSHGHVISVQSGHRHSWSAAVNNRTTGHGCPQCSGRAVCKHNSLATKAPLVAAQWDHKANNKTPEDMLAHSGQRVHWHCHNCGCKWTAAPTQRVGKMERGCPQCAEDNKTKKRVRHPTFAECKHPRLVEWDHKRNEPRGNCPENTKLRSGKQIFWLCSRCPAGQEHSWSAQPCHRTSRHQSGCPFCAGRAACRCNSVQALYPDIAAEWHHDRNLSHPTDYPAFSISVVWWSSPQRGSWQQTIHSRTNQVQQRTARLKHIQERQEFQGLKSGRTEK